MSRFTSRREAQSVAETIRRGLCIEPCLMCVLGTPSVFNQRPMETVHCAAIAESDARAKSDTQ